MTLSRSSLIVALLVASSSLAAQAPATPPATTPGPEVSGVMYLTFQTGGTLIERRVSRQNRFELDRAYLTVRAPAGDRVSVRFTADVYQQRDSTRDSYYAGWAVRMKYAYAQYDFAARPAAIRASARLGMLQTPIIEHEEKFWNRGVASTALEQQGYFRSADMGAATTLTLPDNRGEVYATVINGAGYTSRETDRFKDIGARVVLTPFSASTSLLKTFAVTPWGYKGWRASDYARRRGTVGPIGVGRQKDRFGIHAGIRDPRLVLAGQFAWRMDDVESADTLRATTPTVRDRTGRMTSAYLIAQPLAFIRATPTSSLLTLVRIDHTRPDLDAAPTVTQVIGGLGYQVNPRTQLWLDYQNTDPKNGSTAADVKTLFVRGIINF